MIFNCSGKLIPAVDTISASLFSLSDGWLPAISYVFVVGAPWIRVSSIFCLKGIVQRILRGVNNKLK
jgi:hypothetical protein